jgi:hypothetical protein
MSTITSVQMRPPTAAWLPHLPPADAAQRASQQVVVFRSGDDVEEAVAQVIVRKMLHHTSGRTSPLHSSPQVPAEISMWVGDSACLSGLFTAATTLIEDERAVNSEHYVERMLEFTSGRVSTETSFMLSSLSGRLGVGEEEEEEEVTTDMMRFTSGRLPRLSRDESP